MSNAALATLRVPKSVSETDPLLCLVASLVLPRQLSIVETDATTVELSTRGGATVLRTRNAVLRALCGEALHFALDHAPWYLLGGGGAARSASSAAVGSWCEIASDLRDDDDAGDATKRLLAELESSVLDARSFLVRGCGAATLADLDVYFALRRRDELDLTDFPNVRRWWTTVRATVDAMTKAALRRDVEVRPEHLRRVKGDDDVVVGRPPVVLYYGDEPELGPPPPPSSAAKTDDGTAKGKGKEGGGENEPTKNGDAGKQTPAPAPAGGGGAGGLTDEQKKAAAEKRAKKKAEKAAKNKSKASVAPGGGGAAPAGELNVSALDVRVGKILKVWEHETAEKLFCEEVDLGEESGPRKIASGLRPFYKKEDLDGASVLVLCNLKARSLVGFPSHGMVLCASNADHTSVELVRAPEGAKIGEKVVFETYEKGEPESETRMNKKKIFEKLAPDLRTDADGGVVWKGKKATAGGGQCRAINGMSNATVG